MNRFFAALAVLSVFLVSTSATALDCPTPYLCFLNGNWAADGTSFGKPSRVTMNWQSALDGKFARIDYRIVTKAGDGKEQVFDGIGFYRPLKDGVYDGTWFDSQGAMHPLNATFTGESLTAYWGVKGKTYGRTVYKLVNAYDQVEVVDAIQDKKGNWKEFSRNTLKKSE
ncbi:MAG: hypothetical protein ABL996_05885 [Micropepsaceae bacterium]